VPSQQPTRDPADPASGDGSWERITLRPPSLAFEPGPPRECAYDILDIECEGWSTERFALRAASVRGDSHRWPRRARPRQDCVRATVHEQTGILAFAVADGVSGATHSELGSREACRAALDMLIEQLSRGVPLDLVAVVRHAVERLYELARWRLELRSTDSVAGRDVSNLFATTLVTGLVLPTPEGAVVELCRVGDSGAWVLDRVREPYDARLFVPLFATKTGSGRKFVSNQVAALPQIPAQLEVNRVRLAEQDTLLIGTDGFGDPLGDGDGAFGALFAQHLRTPPTPLWLAHVLDFSRDTFDDDRTLLAVWPQPEDRR
jgi:serine/threonine protein phosphatase PrpC